MSSIPWRRYSARLLLVLMGILTSGNRAGHAGELDGGTPLHGQSGQVKKPQIPTENFEWNGTFRVPGQDEPVITDLTIRGRWQNGHFNLYMEQGFDGGEYWVENLIYQEHLYTITHNWPKIGPPVTGFCYKSQDEITVEDLNAILESAQLVGREKIDRTPVNHFRVSCLSKSQIVIFGVPLAAVTVNIFSDIYVPPGRSHPFTRWLQFGDAVGLSKQHDEWFFFAEYNNHPEEIQLPWQCSSIFTILVLQHPCSNLTDQSD